MTDEKKQELFPYFAYLYSQKLNPDKYGNGKSIDEWTSLIKESPEDIDTITKAASQLSDEDWNSLEQQYESQQEGGAQFAKKGAKLKKLQGMKKGGKAKKCSCGCDLITVKAEGGILTTKCACNCKGGKMKKHQDGGDVVSSQSQTGVAKNGVKLGIKELKKEELKNAEVADPKVTPMQKSLKNKKDITKVMDKETLKRLKSKTKK